MVLLLADDEYHVRARLSTKVDWQALGIDTVLMCDDGDTALEKIYEQPVDILLTDLKMPRMSGITLAQSALIHNPDIKVIFMSAYDDKNFLKQAIGLHVVGYLEKPFSLEEVTETVSEAVQSIEDRKKHTVAKELRGQLRCAQAATMLCRYATHQDEIAEKLNGCEEFMKHSAYVTMLAVFEEEGEEEKNIFSERDAFSFHYPELYQILSDLKLCGIIALTKEQYIIFHLCLDAPDPAQRQDAAVKLYKELQEHYAMFRLHLSAGSVVTSYLTLHRSYQEAVIGSKRHFFSNEPILLSSCNEETIYTFQEKAFEDFQQALTVRDKKACYEYMESLYRGLLANTGTLVRDVKNHYFRLLLLIISEIPSFKALLDHTEHSLWEILSPITSLDKLNNYTIELLDTFFAPLAAENPRTEQINHTLTYIHKNLSDPGLSLGDISKANYMSVPYLCMYFKEQTGTTIRAYIIDARMKTAKRLLLESSSKIAEIAEQCGFSDQNYFTKCFSKYYGISPSKFRETGRRSENSEEV